MATILRANFKDYIPEGEETPIGNQSFTDFVPPKEPEFHPEFVATPEVKKPEEVKKKGKK